MKQSRFRFLIPVCLGIFIVVSGLAAFAQLESRTPTGGSNIITRKCVGGDDAGTLCKEDSECDSNNCFDYNMIDLTVNFRSPGGGGWTPTAAQMTTIRGYFPAINNTIADVTEGQMALGTIALIVDNGAPNAVVQLTAGTCRTGGGNCLTDADCGAGDTCDGGGGSTNTGDWGNRGKISIGPFCLQEPLCFAHEFMHLIGNVRDEYEGALDDTVNNDGDSETDECQENQWYWRCFGGTDDGEPCSLCIGGTNPHAPCTADADCGVGGRCPAHPAMVNCGGGGTCREIVCIDPGPPTDPLTVVGCLMRCCLDITGSELCWSGNHDPFQHTEQSQCRNGNDCWTQLATEWPSVILSPPAGPVAGPAVSPTVVSFITPSVLDRFVAVIDRSASMSTETPARMDVAVTATKDFVDLLNDGTDFGLASFASADGSPDPPDVDASKDFPPEAGLRALNTNTDRNDAKSAVDGLATRTGGWTRIGAGLRQARDMLLEAGGAVTLNTTVLLLTDGINNRPEDDPQGDLDDALQQLANDNIPIFVTCIGEARDSTQCSYIADQTAGRFVDSADTDSLYDAFVEFAAEAQRLEISRSQSGTEISEGVTSSPVFALIEDNVQSVRFVVTWTKDGTDLDLRIYTPANVQLSEANKIEGSHGEYYLVSNPTPGTWKMEVVAVAVPDSPDKFSARAIVEHRELNVEAGLTKATITWPDVFHLSASPSMGLPIKGCQVSATVQKPDGTTEIFSLYDDGSAADSLAGDGLYQAKFRDFTAGDGIYTFVVSVDCQSPEFYQDSEPGIGPFPNTPIISAFTRTIRFSGTVNNVPANLPPVARICADVQAQCEGASTAVELDGSCSSDPEGQPLTFEWYSPTGSIPGTTANPTGSFPLGVNDVTLVVNDGENDSEPDDALVIIFDTLAPEITCPADATVECDQSTAPANTGVPTATDACTAEPATSYSDVETPGSCPAEKTITRKWTATDSVGNSSSCEQTITVVDTTPPDVQCNVPGSITPPDAPISFAITATDNCDNAPTYEITGFDCFKYTKKGARVDKTESCVVEVSGDTITIIDSGGVGDNISFTTRAVDSCGNVNDTQECKLEVVNPAKE